MNYQEFSDKIGALIGQDDLPAAIKEMEALLQHSRRLDEVILQSGRLSALRKEIRLGTIDPADARLTKNQIRFALLEFLQDIEEHAAADVAIQQELATYQSPNPGIVIQQQHSGSGDNVGGDKVTYNRPPEA